MKVGDLVTGAGPFCVEHTLGVIAETREVAATRRVDKGKNTRCHFVYWSLPSPRAEWIMERDLGRGI